MQVKLANELSGRGGCQVISECSIQACDGVRVADVAWISDERLAELGWATPFPKAPEIGIDILSPSHSWAERHVKAGHDLEAGAEQVWVVGVRQTDAHRPGQRLRLGVWRVSAA